MRCPVCNVQVETGPACRRCRADLSMLFRLEDERASLCASALQAIKLGQGKKAVRVASAIAALRPGADATRLCALGLLLQRDYVGAYQATLSPTR